MIPPNEAPVNEAGLLPDAALFCAAMDEFTGLAATGGPADDGAVDADAAYEAAAEIARQEAEDEAAEEYESRGRARRRAAFGMAEGADEWREWERDRVRE